MKNEKQIRFYIGHSASRHSLLSSKLDQAIKDEDWESVAVLIEWNPDFMEEGLARVYPILPDEYKFSIPTSCYLHNGDSMPLVRKYVRQARKLLPVEQRVPSEMIAMPEITVYRAGAEPLSQSANRLSWTTSIDVARWFYDRAKHFKEKRHLYQGVIAPERIIWYTDDRQEKEVIQYRGVRNVIEIER